MKEEAQANKEKRMKKEFLVDLKFAIADYLETLDPRNKDEHYGTERELASRFMKDFTDWLFRKDLNKIPLDMTFKQSQKVITMSKGQWDKTLEDAYHNLGFILLELDDNGIPIAMYKKELT